MSGCQYKFMKVTFILILNVSYIIGLRIPACEESTSNEKCFYFINKQATREDAYETCANLNSSLSSYNDLRKVIVTDKLGKLGKLWTSYSFAPPHNGADIECFKQKTPSNVSARLRCVEKDGPRFITIENKYKAAKDCLAFHFFEEKFYFLKCDTTLQFICIHLEGNATGGSFNNVSGSATNSSSSPMEKPQLLHLDEKSYKNLTLNCNTINITAVNVELSSVNGKNYRISEDLKWPMIKNMPITVKCSNNTNRSMIYKIIPVHSFEFLIRSNSSGSMSFDKSSAEYAKIYNEISMLTDGKFFNFVIPYERNLESWKPILKFLNETELKMAARLILKRPNYIPLFCVEESWEYGFGTTVKWDFTKGDEYQVPEPNICRTRVNDNKKRKCKVRINDDDMPKYEWSPYDIEKCSSSALCPPDYEAVGKSSCVKLTTANDFESHFYNLIGIEDSIADVMDLENETDSILNYIRSKGYNDVLKPLLKLDEFDIILLISRSAKAGSYMVYEQSFNEFGNTNQYYSYNIDTKRTLFQDSLNGSTPYISVINVKEFLKSYNSSLLFSKANPSLTSDNFCSGYFSHYDGKCIIISKSDVSRTWRSALDYCKSESLDLFSIGNEFLEDGYRKMLTKENIDSAWMGPLSKAYKRRKILTTSGIHVLKSNAKLGNIICQTKPRYRTPSVSLTMILTEQVNDTGTFLCLKFSHKTLDFLQNFPTCYCYPAWQILAQTKSNNNLCDYNIQIKYSSKCRCTAVILHMNSQSIIHSNKVNFYNRSFNYFIVYIAFQSRTLQIKDIKNVLESTKNHIPVVDLSYNTCHKSHIHTDYSSKNYIFGRSYILNIACPEHVHSEAINVKETERLLRQNSKNMNVSVTLRASDGCHRNILRGNLQNLTWEKTNHEGFFQPVELCITQSNVPAYRKCEGNYYIGFKWNPFNENCKQNVTEFEKHLRDLKINNATNKIDELQETLSYNIDKITPFAIYATSEILFNTDRKSNYSVRKVINIVNNILESPVENVSDINVHGNASSKILESFDELLISQIPFNYTTEEEKTNNNDQIVVFGGNIPEVDNKLPSALGIENKNNNKYALKYLDTLRDENESTSVIVSIPESLRKKDLKLSYVYKQWKNKLFFDDPSLEEKNLKIVGDVIDVNFVNLKNQKKIEDINDNITIKVKPNSAYKNKSFLCVSWNLENGSWSTDSCLENLKESNINYIACTCNHASHYAFLFHVQISAVHTNALNIIVYLGSSISIFFMLIIIISDLLLKKWPKHEDCEARTLINLCVAILGATMSMLIGGSQKGHGIFCDIFAAILHYFLICSFFWMSSEALFKYLIFVKGHFFLDYKLFKRSFFISWGIPVVICIILWSSRSIINQQYHMRNSCWLMKTEMYFYFLLPLALFMTFNLFVYFSIIFSFWRMLRTEKNPRNSENLKKRYKRVIYEVIGLGFLFGLTWLLGLFLMTGNKTFTVTIAYIFSILQSLQGALIFLRVYSNKLFRDEWRHYLNNLKGYNSRSQDIVSAMQRSNMS